MSGCNRSTSTTKSNSLNNRDVCFLYESEEMLLMYPQYDRDADHQLRSISAVTTSTTRVFKITIQYLPDLPQLAKSCTANHCGVANFKTNELSTFFASL